MLADDPSHALLLGRMAQDGESALGVLPLAGAAFGVSGGGALAVSARQLWLTQPQLVGTQSVASVPLSSVGAVTLRGHNRLGGGLRIEVVVAGRPMRLITRADAVAVEDFAAAVAAARNALDT